MIEQSCKLSWLWIIAAVSFAQNAPPREKCQFDQERAQDVRRIAASVAATYYFACQESNPNADASGCIKGTIKPGLVVTLNRTSDGWACISGSDSISGWMQTSVLEALPSEPRIPLQMWEGWWERPAKERVKGERNDRLLITPTKEPGLLRVSGRAYWYGINGVVHYGQINGEASPVGKYLHVVSGMCVLHLEFRSSDPAKFQAQQIEFQSGCGGMNVSFSGEWMKFTPRSKKSAFRKENRGSGLSQRAYRLTGANSIWRSQLLLLVQNSV